MANLVIKNKTQNTASLTFDTTGKDIELNVEDGVLKIVQVNGNTRTTLLTIDNYLSLTDKSYGTTVPGNSVGAEGSIFFKIIE